MAPKKDEKGEGLVFFHPNATNGRQLGSVSHALMCSAVDDAPGYIDIDGTETDLESELQREELKKKIIKGEVCLARHPPADRPACSTVLLASAPARNAPLLPVLCHDKTNPRRTPVAGLAAWHGAHLPLVQGRQEEVGASRVHVY
jgi:hypothetical protein